MNSRAVKISLLVFIVIILSYLGLQNVSASNITSNIEIQMYGIPNTNTILDEKTFDIQFELEVQTRGYLSVARASKLISNPNRKSAMRGHPW